MAPESKSAPADSGQAPLSGKEIDVNGSTSGSEVEVSKGSKGNRDGVTFATHGLRQDAYRPVDSYEGLHRYDPEFEWEPEEERKVIRKVSRPK
jgi:hypothetical protein